MEYMVPQRRYTGAGGGSVPRHSSTKPSHVPEPHHDHHHHHHYRHHRDKNVPQSAVQLTSSSTFPEPGPRKLAGRSLEDTPAGSATQSRRDSTAVGEEDRDVTGLERDMEMTKDHVFTELDLSLAKERARIRNEELLTCLAQINHYSNTTTRRLDDTYYSILEKLSALQSAVASLQEVSNLTSQLQSDFEGEARNLEQDIKGQVDEVGEFEAQQEMVTALEARLKAGKEKSDMLVERLDAVRGSLAGWERKEGEWQASMSRRLRILWAIIAVCILTFVALIIFHYSGTHSQHDKDSRPPRHFNGSMALKDLLQELEGQRTRPPEVTASHTGQGEQLVATEDDRLRIFDEL